MLDRLWHLRRTIVVEGAESDSTILDRVSHLLDKQGKSVHERNAQSLSFDDRLQGRTLLYNISAMVIYSGGKFWIERTDGQRKLYYDLNSHHAIIFCLFATSLAFYFGWNEVSFIGGGLFGGLMCSVVSFAFLYGLNVLLALLRVPSAIRKAVARA